eukprot:gene5958-6197_t
MALVAGRTQSSALQKPTTVRSIRVQPFSGTPAPCRGHRYVVRAADDDAELEQRLAALRKGKGATPDGEGSKAKRRAPTATADPQPKQEVKKTYDFSNETVHWEGGPAAGDLAFNIALGATLVALPLTIGAITRSAFVKYKFTDKRVSEVRDVRTVSRGLGAWGDMVIELKNGDKLELRSLEKFKELRDYVLARRDALGGGPRSSKTPSMMDLDLDDDEAMKKKGFA